MRKLLFPILVFLFVSLIVFREFFFKGMLPIPGDLLIGAYFPWLDSKWGFTIGVPVKNPMPSDVISLLYPWRSLGMSIIRSGHLPLWDSTILLGTPLLANFQSALLNPLNVLFLFLPHPLAWSIEVALQPFLIALAAFFYLKNLGLKNISATFGSLAFAFSGFSVVWMEYNTIGFALIFVPLTLLFIDKIIQKPKPLFSFFLAASLCLQLLSGYPQITIYTLIFSVLYFVYRVKDRPAGFPIRLVFFSIGITSGLLLSAVQLLPSFELLQHSIRSTDPTAFLGGIQFLPIQHLITFFVPDFFGNPATGNYWSTGSFDNFAFALPTVAAFFILVAVFSKNIFRRQYLIFTLLTGLSLLLALDTPPGKILTSFEFLGLRSAVAARVLFLTDFFLTVIAALTLEEMLTKPRSLFQHLTPLFTYFGLTLGLLIVWAIFRFHFPTLTSEFAHIEVAVRNSLLPLLSIGLLSVAFIFFDKRPLFLVTVIFILLVFGIVKTTDKYLTFTKTGLLYPQTEALNFLQQNLKGHRFDREKGELLPANTWIPYGLKTPAGQNALSLVSVNKYFAILSNTYPKLPSRFIDLADISSPLYKTLDVKFLAVLNRDPKTFSAKSTGQPLPQFSSPNFPESANFGTVRLLENRSNLGPAWFSRSVVCQKSEMETIKVLQNFTFDPQNLAVINCESGQAINNLAPGTITEISESPNQLTLTVNNPTVNFLIFSQTFYPGWEAFIDGAETKIYTANLALVSIPVPPGSHTVWLKYNPTTFFLGLKISLFTLFTWLAALMLFHLKKKHA